MTDEKPTPKKRRSISKGKLYREIRKAEDELVVAPDISLNLFLERLRDSMLDDLIGDLDG